MSQKELADQVNVTPSFLSQLESDQVSPSLPTFLQICRVLGVNPGQFLGAGQQKGDTSWLLRRESILSRPAAREDAARIYDVAPEGKHSVRLVVLPAGATLNRHFSFHKEAEFIYVVKGELAVTMGGREERIASGDVLCLKESFPSQWKNKGGDEAELLVLW